MQLFQGDCISTMKQLPDGSVDMILTDPPYGVTACGWDDVLPFGEMWGQFRRLLRPTGSCVVFGNTAFTAKLICSNLPWYKYSWVWVKNRPTGSHHAKNRPMGRHEDIAVFSPAPMGHVSLLGERRMTYNPQGVSAAGKKTVKATGFHGRHVGPRPNQIGREYDACTGYPSTVLCFDKEETHYHPTQKPVSLLSFLIRSYTLDGSTVLDPFMGSGSTGVACQETNRNFIGIELDPDYYRIAETRTCSSH